MVPLAVCGGGWVAPGSGQCDRGFDGGRAKHEGFEIRLLRSNEPGVFRQYWGDDIVVPGFADEREVVAQWYPLFLKGDVMREDLERYRQSDDVHP